MSRAERDADIEALVIPGPSYYRMTELARLAKEARNERDTKVFLLSGRELTSRHWYECGVESATEKAEANFSALRAELAKIEQIATNYRESDSDHEETVYRVGLTVVRDMLRKALAQE